MIHRPITSISVCLLLLFAQSSHCQYPPTAPSTTLAANCPPRPPKSIPQLDSSTTIRACQGAFAPFRIDNYATSANNAKVDALKLQLDERLVAENGHLEGCRPVSYNMSFVFRNKTHYEAQAEIVVEIVARTKRIVLNRARSAPEIDYARIYLKSLCDVGKIKDLGCIQRTILTNQTFVLELTKGLEPGDRYQIVIPSFRSHANDPNGETGSVGLAIVGGEETGEEGGVTTIFQMRYARTVFPCFDYPSLKATFELCLTYPQGWKAATNTQPKSPKITIDSGLERQCFEETPIIPTYVFTLGLMQGYNISTLQTSNGLQIEFYAPKMKSEQLQYIMRRGQLALERMESITGVPYPLWKLGFYVAYPAPFWGIENLGMITLEGAWMDQGADSQKAISIVNHEIVHQWIGDRVTISEWREICLQEGLTAFLEWKLSEELQNISMNEQAAEAFGGKRDYLPYLTQYNRTQDIADRCFGLPPIFFKMIYDFYGFEPIQKFVRNLLAQKSFANANIDEYDRILADSIGDDRYRGYLSNWFGQSGYAYVFISNGKNERDFRITQGRVEDFEHVVITKDTTTKPFPLKVLTSTGDIKKYVIPKVQNYTISVDDRLLMLDPDDSLAAKKIYTLNWYKKFVCPLPITEDSMHSRVSAGNLNKVLSDVQKSVKHSIGDEEEQNSTDGFFLVHLSRQTTTSRPPIQTWPLIPMGGSSPRPSATTPKTHKPEASLVSTHNNQNSTDHTAQNGSSVAKCDSRLLTPVRVKSIWGDFCKALLLDVYPWGEDDGANFDAQSWTALFHDLVKGRLLKANLLCRCCIGTEEENLKKKSCYWNWNNGGCTRLRINRLLRRNYTLPKRGPSVRPWEDEDVD